MFSPLFKVNRKPLIERGRERGIWQKVHLQLPCNEDLVCRTRWIVESQITVVEFSKTYGSSVHTISSIFHLLRLNPKSGQANVELFFFNDKENGDLDPLCC